MYVVKLQFALYAYNVYSVTAYNKTYRCLIHKEESILSIAYYI